MKTIAAIAVILFASGFLPFGCCKTPKPYFNIYGVRATLTESFKPNETLPDNLTTSTNFLELRIHASLGLIAGSAWGNAAFACRKDGTRGVKDKLTTVTITSNMAFDGVEAGQPINNFLHIPDNAGSPLPIESAIESFNRHFGSFPAFAFTEKPNEGGYRSFAVLLTFESGKQLFGETSAINWE